MRNAMPVGLIFLGASLIAGCAFNTHGNREDARRLITRTKDLRHFVNKQVTLVGTARADARGDSSIDLRGGSVAVPAYEWPEGSVDQRVSVTGILFEGPSDRGARTYRLGEVKTATLWSR